MFNLLRLTFVWSQKVKVRPELKFLSLYPRLLLKEIQEIKEGNDLIIQGKPIPSPRVAYLLQNHNRNVCPVCSSGLDIKHTDVLILSQFLRQDGCMLPRRITGLCRKQQKRISTLVAMAQKAGLMPNLNPENSKRDPKLRTSWKKYNKYFNETTIKT